MAAINRPEAVQCIEHLHGALESKKICISVQRVGGLGDLACASKVVKILEQNGLECLINTDKESQEFLKNIFYIGSDDTFIDTKSIASKIDEIGLFIVAPYTGSHFHLAKYEKPLLFLHEYAHSFQLLDNERFFFGKYLEHKTMGFGPDDIGILIDDELVKYCFSEEAENRIRCLSELTDDVLIKAIINTDDVNAGIGEFEQTSKLFQGYSDSPLFAENFITAIAELESEEEKNLVFVIPGDGFSFGEGGIERLRQSGIREIITRNVNDDSESRHPVSDEGKTLTLVCGSIPHGEIRMLLKASERCMLTTGDQSVGEAISANKQIIYEALAHKERFGKQLNRLYGNSVSIKSDCRNLHDDMKAILEAQRNNSAAWTKINKGICYKRNCAPRILQLASSVMERHATKFSSKESIQPYEGEFELNKRYLIPPKDLWALRISTETNKSDLPGYEDFVFRLYSFIDAQTCLIVKQNDPNL